ENPFQKHEEALYAYGKHCLDKTLDIDFEKGFSAIMQVYAFGNKNATILLSAISRIQFNKPTVVIKNGNETDLFDDKLSTDASKFISVDATISPGRTATAQVGVIRLLSLLSEKKDDI